MYQPSVAALDRRLSSAEAYHLLRRFTFTPRQKDIEHATSLTSTQWMEWQLSPQLIDDTKTERMLQQYRTALAAPAELPTLYSKESVVRRGAVEMRKVVLDAGKLLQHARAVQLVRRSASDRQLLEVMVDFWFNHFNVYARKGPVKLLVTDYLERTIRPHALGRFEDLLLASARHPAMLIYLDNFKSTATSSKPYRRGADTNAGITENYARELLELHTIGVGAGYMQRDVIEVARIFTGWTLRNPEARDYSFIFDPTKHDPTPKMVMGRSYAQGDDRDGTELLRWLARHPATARHVATKLCARFVADEEDPSCIKAVASAFIKTRGDIKSLLRTIVNTRAFWKEERRGGKVKSPHEFLVGSLRVLGARVNSPEALSRWGEALGQPLLLQPLPTGYSEDSKVWLSTGGMLARMNFATALASNHVYGTGINVNQLLDAKVDRGIVAQANRLVLAGTATPRTLDIIHKHVAKERLLVEKRRLALAMALASPDFQRQ